MKFKYHKSYRGFYLLEDKKFKRPYRRLDEEKTLEKLPISVEFNRDKIIEIEDSLVVFFEKGKTSTINKKEAKRTTKIKGVRKEKGIDFLKLELKYEVPSLFLKNLYTIISENGNTPKKELLSVLSVIENIIRVDGVFASKVKKMFYYSEEEFTSALNRYELDKLRVEVLKKEIELNYPDQYISDLPLDYKEYEMIFVFYFIILIELLSILK